MAKLDPTRLRNLENRVGFDFPPEFVASLEEREPIHEGNLAIVTPDRVWDVRTTFHLANGGSRHDQLDLLYGRVGDVLPKGALPFARDWGGNFYCLLLSGPERGTVVWWDHERDSDDDRVEVVCASIGDFYSQLTDRPDDAG